MTNIYNRFTGPSDTQGYLIALEVRYLLIPQEMLLKIKEYIDSKIIIEEIQEDEKYPF